jgi:hypothetical protein
LWRRGIARLQLIIVLGIVMILGGIIYQNLMVSLPVNERIDNTNMTAQGNPPTQNSTQEIKQEYRVTDIVIDQMLVPSGIPMGITVKLEKISGQDPFPITLSISGEPLETRKITFGESKEIDTHFVVTLTRQGRYEAHLFGVRKEFEVRVMPVEVEWITVTPREAESNEEIMVSFGARNINNIPVSDWLNVEVMPDYYFIPVQLSPLSYEVRARIKNKWQDRRGWHTSR